MLMALILACIGGSLERILVFGQHQSMKHCPGGPGRHRPMCEVCAKEVSPTEATITVCSKVVHHACAETHCARCRERRPLPRSQSSGGFAHQSHGGGNSQVVGKGVVDTEGSAATRSSRSRWLPEEKGAEATSCEVLFGDCDSCNWSFDSEGKASDSSCAVKYVGALRGLSPRSRLRVACSSQFSEVAKPVESKDLFEGNDIVRLAEVGQEGKHLPAALQHSSE